MIYLSLIAVIEAVVYQARYRSAVVGGPFVAAWWTLATQALRVAWLAIGVGELMHGADLVLVIAVYGFPAAIAVGVMRAMDQRCEGRMTLARFVSDQERADAEKWCGQVDPVTPHAMVKIFIRTTNERGA